MVALSKEDREQIQGFLQKAEGGLLVQSINGLHDFLMSRNLAWKLRLTCDMVGVHHQNRDGIGCSAGHVQDLVSNIAAIGFVESEVKAICVEVPQASSGDVVRAFNKCLVQDAGGKLAPFDPASLRYASIVGSHTNQAFRAIRFNVAHPDGKLTVDGRLSMEKLAVIDPAWHTAISQGILWTVISHQVTEEFPQYAPLAQAAGNAAGQIASVEHELQLARKVNLAIERVMRQSGQTQVSYSQVSGDILRSRPPNASSLPGIYSFVLKFGGGTGPDAFLQLTERHIRSHGYVNRTLGADLWQALAMELKSKTQHAPFRRMMIKLGLCGPERILTVTDVKRILTSKEGLQKIAEAEAMILQIAKLLKPVVKEHQAFLTEMSQLEIQAAALVLQKHKFVKHESIPALCNDFLTNHGIASPWASEASSSVPEPPKPSAAGEYLA